MLHLLVLLLVVTGCERESTHPHAVRRDKLVAPDTDAALLPEHGAVMHAWYLGGETLEVFDLDARTVRLKIRHDVMVGQPSEDVDKTKALTGNEVAAVRNATFAAWHEDPSGNPSRAFDIREDLIVLDGAEAFHVSGYPLSHSNRPEATKALELLDKLAE